MTQPDQTNDTGAQQSAEALRATAKQLQQKAGAVLAAVTPQAASAAAAAQNRFGKVFARLLQSALLGKVLRPVEAFADWIVGIARIRWMLAAAYPAQTSSAEFKVFLLFFGALALSVSLLFIVGTPILFTGGLSDVLDTVILVILPILSLPLLVSGKRAIPNRQVPRYMSFSGRAGRMEFSVAVPFFVVMALMLPYILEKIVKHADLIHYSNYRFLNYLLYLVIILLLPVFAACSRRLHDTGRSGWIQLPLHVATVMVPSVVTSAIFGKGDFTSVMESCGGINLEPNCVLASGILNDYHQSVLTDNIMTLFCIAASILLFYGRKGHNGRNRFGGVAPRLRDIKPFQEQVSEQPPAAAADEGIAQSATATPLSAADAIDETPPGRE